MNRKTTAVLLSGLLVACAQTQSPEATAQSEPAPAAAAESTAAPTSTPAAEPAPVDHIVNIRRASCQDLLKLSPDDLDAASMFYIGYQASHFRTSTINVGLIPSIEAQALTYCTENPNRTVAQAFAEAYLRTRK
jgi:hypothetical protein